MTSAVEWRAIAVSAPIRGAFWAVLMFGAAGTISALWPNPIFVRMTPAGSLEIVALLAMSTLFGAYMAIRRPACSAGLAYGGGFTGFIGVACPVCNKLLLVLFGSELLLVYFEPVRLYVAFFGVTVLAFALWRELSARAAE